MARRKTLKPCPHCGKQAYWDEAYEETNEQGNTFWRADIFCGNLLECGASVSVLGFTKEDAEERAKNAWNRRAEQ